MTRIWRGEEELENKISDFDNWFKWKFMGQFMEAKCYANDKLDSIIFSCLFSNGL